MSSNPEDAGSIVSELRLSITQMEKDGIEAQKSMDRLAVKFKQQGQTAGTGFAGGMKKAFTDVDQNAAKLGRNIGKSLAPQMIALQAGIKIISGIAGAFKDAFMANEKFAKGVTALKASLGQSFASVMKPVSDFFGDVIEKATESTRKTMEAQEALKKMKEELTQIQNRFSASNYASEKNLEMGLSEKLDEAKNKIREYDSMIKSLIEQQAKMMAENKQLTPEQLTAYNKLNADIRNIAREMNNYQWYSVKALEREAELAKEILISDKLKLDNSKSIKEVKGQTVKELEEELKIQSARVGSLDAELELMNKLITDSQETLRLRAGQRDADREANRLLGLKISAAETEKKQLQSKLNDEKKVLNNINAQIDALKKKEEALQNAKWLNDIQLKQYGDINKQIVEQLKSEAAVAKTEKERNDLLNNAINLENTLIEKQRAMEKQGIVNSESFKAQSADVKAQILRDFDQITEGMMKTQEKLTQGKKEKGDNWLANLMGLTDKQLGNMMSVGEAAINSFDSISNSALEITRQHAEEQMAIIDKALEGIIKSIEEARQAELIAAGFAVENNIESLEAQLEAARRTGDEVLIYQRERRLEEQRINDEFDAQAKAAQDKAAKDKAEIEFELAKHEYALKMVQAVNAGAMAILQALQSAPPPWNFALAALSGAAAGVQIGMLAKNPPKMPTFESGGIVPGTSYTGDKTHILANSREGIFTLEDQEYLFDQIQGRKIGDSSVAATIVVMLDSREIGEATFDLANKGYYTLKTRAVQG
jgi:hypothetical protein